MSHGEKEIKEVLSSMIIPLYSRFVENDVEEEVIFDFREDLERYILNNGSLYVNDLIVVALSAMSSDWRTVELDYIGGDAIIDTVSPTLCALVGKNRTKSDLSISDVRKVSRFLNVYGRRSIERLLDLTKDFLIRNTSVVLKEE